MNETVQLKILNISTFIDISFDFKFSALELTCQVRMCQLEKSKWPLIDY